MFVEPQTQLTTLGKVMGPLSTPTKGSEASGGEPWTPTSNLKMLISAASPEIRNREKEKNSTEETESSSQVTVTMNANISRVHSPGFIYILLRRMYSLFVMDTNIL